MARAYPHLRGGNRAGRLGLGDMAVPSFSTKICGIAYRPGYLINSRSVCNKPVVSTVESQVRWRRQEARQTVRSTERKLGRRWREFGRSARIDDNDRSRPA